MRRTASFLVLSMFLFLQVLPYLPTTIQNIPLLYSFKKASIFHPSEIDAIGLSSASATLSNPRLSFDAISNTSIPIGGTIGVTQASGVGSDWDTRNLFPKDNLVVTGNAAIPVASVSSDLVTFTLQTGLTTGSTAGSTHMTVAQSGTMTVRFYTASTIPAGGSIKLTIPAPTSGGNDGVPLAAASLAANGFDTNGMSGANVTCPANFNTATVTTGVGVPHVVYCNNAGGAVPPGANITFVVGNTTIGLVNPAPTAQRTSVQRGIADIYTITAATYSSTAGGGSLIEDIQMKTAPVEGVLVTATVDETLSFTVAGVAAGAGTFCGKAHTAGITTTATSVPWGTISSGYTIDKNEAVQQLIVTTNAAGGYKVYAEENDQMGDEGAVCVGSAGANADNPTSGSFTFTGNTCIRDFEGAASNGSNTTATEWGATAGTLYGFGYALQNNSGTDGTQLYNTGGTYMARTFTDIQNTNMNKYATNAELMTASIPVSGSAVYVCYRINIPGTQPAGYYYNKLKYTAVPKF